MKYLLIIILAALSACQSKKDVVLIDNRPESVELFAEGVVSTGLYERDIAISAHGDEVIFTVGDYKQSKRGLVRIVKRNDIWTEPEILSFSGKHMDIEPFITPDGLKLFFASDRPTDGNVEREDYNIWVADRVGDDWGEPYNLDTVISTESNEYYPSVSSNGNLYFTATKDDGFGGEDILMSRFIDGKYLHPVVLDTMINTEFYEYNAFISPDEEYIIFGSYGREDGMGGGDLYVSVKDIDGQWTEALNLGKDINTESLDYCPFVDVHRGNFYFTSERKTPVDKVVTTYDEFTSLAQNVNNGMGNIYRVSLEKILSKKK